MRNRRNTIKIHKLSIAPYIIPTEKFDIMKFDFTEKHIAYSFLQKDANAAVRGTPESKATEKWEDRQKWENRCETIFRKFWQTRTS